MFHLENSEECFSLFLFSFLSLTKIALNFKLRCARVSECNIFSAAAAVAAAAAAVAAAAAAAAAVAAAAAAAASALKHNNDGQLSSKC